MPAKAGRTIGSLRPQVWGRAFFYLRPALARIRSVTYCRDFEPVADFSQPVINDNLGNAITFVVDHSYLVIEVIAFVTFSAAYTARALPSRRHDPEPF